MVAQSAKDKGQSPRKIPAPECLYLLYQVRSNRKIAFLFKRRSRRFFSAFFYVNSGSVNSLLRLNRIRRKFFYTTFINQ